MHFITRMYSPPLYITTCHARDGVSNTPKHSNHIYTAEFLSNRRPRRRGMAASSPLHSDGSASRQPSSPSLHGITASNAALPSHKVEGLVGPLRPLSGSRSCGGQPRPHYPSHLRTRHASRHTLMQEPCAHTHVLGFFRRPPCGERQG